MMGILGVCLLMMVMSCGKSNPLTPANPPIITPSGTMTDIDGNVYQTVKIGNQVWTVENLRTTKYNDGTTIPLDTSTAIWGGLTTPAYCYYNNTTNTDSITKFGALYNWYAVNTGKLAPAGWHVPTDSEWEVMKNYLEMHGYNYDRSIDTANNFIAVALAAQADWNSNTYEGTPGYNFTKNNSSGFSALPGGWRDNLGGSKFYDLGDHGYWWSATMVMYGADTNQSRLFIGFPHVLCHSLIYNRYDLLGDYLLPTNDLNCGFSVRLVKDN